MAAERAIKVIPTHSANWQNIISAPLEENLVSLFLTNLASFIDGHYLPSPKHVQILLYLALNPPLDLISHSPISLLYKLLSIHSPSSFAHCLPSVPTSAEAREYPRWLNWEANGRTQEDVKRRMRECREDGVWGLLWVCEKVKKVKGQRNVEGDEDEKEERVVSEHGWEVLEWLVAAWEKDRKEGEKNKPSRGYSSVFLQQLARPYSSPDLQMDDATLPLTIIRSAFVEPISTIPAEEGRRQRDVTLRVLILLIQAALPTSRPFHPPSLILSLVTLFRSLPLTSLILLIPAITRKIPWNISAHLYTMMIEDFAGTRVLKAEERQWQARKRRKLETGASHSHNSDLQEGHGALPPPTIKYACELLAIPLARTAHQAERYSKMVFLKLWLLTIMMGQTGMKDSTWSGAIQSIGEGWKERVEDSLTVPDGLGAEEAKLVEGMRRGLLSLVSML